MKILFKIPLFILSFSFNSSFLLSQENISDGYTRFYYPNQQVASEGFMKNGSPDGYWKTYDVNGIIKSEGLRSNWLLDSTWTFYNDVGEVIERINYKYGKKNGYSYKYSYDNNTEPVIISKELYVNDRREGKAYYFYEDGKIKEEISFSDGVKNGTGKEFNQMGEIITLFEYKNNYLVSREKINRYDAQGRKQGPWKMFFTNGKVHIEMKYIDDLLDGYYKEFNENGNLVLSLKYQNGKIVENQDDIELKELIDFKRQLDNAGNLLSSGGYINNKPVGVHRYYNNSGKIINSKIFNEYSEVVAEGIVNENGSKEGPWKEYFSNGGLKASGNYYNNLRNGKWTYYYKNGSIEQEGFYLNGLYDGIWTWYYSNGNIWREESYFNGIEDGEMVEYSDSGSIINKGEYVNGEKEGPWFYQVNDHTESGIYQSGLKSGVWKYFYENGQLQFVGEFYSDLPEGKHKFYYPDGNLKEERYYKRGVREKNWKKYDESGVLSLTITYKNDQEFRINGVKINLPKSSVKTLK